MNTNTIMVSGRQYEIKVEKLQDDSLEGVVSRDGRQIIKMNLSAIDASDIKDSRGENPSKLIMRLLEDFTKSGFIIGRA
jgi:hypothetical protein